jgi:F0F1-type ATP synthase assembly protein I
MKNATPTSEMTLGTQIAIASELGSYIVLTCLLGYFGGNWLDGFLKCAPYGVVGGLMLGLGVGLTIVVKRSEQLDKVKTKPSFPSSSGPDTGVSEGESKPGESDASS